MRLVPAVAGAIVAMLVCRLVERAPARTLGGADPASEADPGPASAPSRRSWSAAIGHEVRRRVGRPPDDRLDQRLGRLLVVGLLGATLTPAAGAAGAAVVLMLPVLRARSRRRARNRSLVDEVPDVVDLTRIGIDAGLTVRLALEAVVKHGSGVLVDALALALAQADNGVRLADALEAVRALGDPVRPFVDALIASERYGAPALAGLDRAAADARLTRRRRGEEAARRVPVKMLFPLVLCTLPALGLLTVVPLLARSVPSLTP